MNSPLVSAINQATRPITVHEFRDALLSTVRPRFPSVRHARARRVGKSHL